jgi:hypothetical protein
MGEIPNWMNVNMEDEWTKTVEPGDRDTNREIADRAGQANQTPETDKIRRKRTGRAASRGIYESRHRRSELAHFA